MLREEEFAPVKNANGSSFDTPESAKLLVLRLHTRWVIAAGGFLTHSVPLYATGKRSIIYPTLIFHHYKATGINDHGLNRCGSVTTVLVRWRKPGSDLPRKNISRTM